MRRNTSGSATVLKVARMDTLIHRPRKAARAAGLRYVHDGHAGIVRKRAGKGWSYSKQGKKITDEVTLARVRALAIPPAWSNVWICADPDGHLQATGVDAKGRKQYRYHKRWASVRGQVKYHRLKSFGTCLPVLRKKIRQDMRKHGLPREKVLAGVVRLMERTRIRVGNRAYEQSNGSFGLSTLKDRHVKREGKGLRIQFKGKSGVVHNIHLESARLARLVMRCKELPGQELFQYKDDQGEVHDVDSGMINDYIRSASGGEFSSKDLRTWMGSARCIDALLAMGRPANKNLCVQCINKALDEVADHLGNTRAVCKAHYVHPGVMTAYAEERLGDLAKGVRNGEEGIGLSRSEHILMKICSMDQHA